MYLIAEWLRLVVGGLFNQNGLPWFVGGLGLSLALVLVRLYLDRKSLTFEEVYNSKIGFHRPFDRHTRQDSDAILQNFNNVSVIVIRIWNSGRGKIEDADFIQPLELAVDERFIVDFRASQVLPPTLASPALIESAWRVGRKADDLNSANLLRQSKLREELPKSLYSEKQGGFSMEERDARRKLMIAPSAMARGNSMKIVVCLREDEDLREEATADKQYTFDGKLSSGAIVQRGKRRPLLTVLAAFSALVGAVSVLALVVIALTPAPPYFCSTGSVDAVGSSAFRGTARYATESFAKECKDAQIDTSQMSSSLEGVRRLQAAQSPTVAFSDGVPSDAVGLSGRPVAILTYNLIINHDIVNVSNLTTAQIRSIYSGAVTNWSKLGGPDMPIRLVGRNGDSGTRIAFERYVLGGSEGGPTSNNCLALDRGISAAITRCERQTTDDVVTAVAQTEGAMGYVDTSVAGSSSDMHPINIDGIQGGPDFLGVGYKFWTIEYAYEKPGSTTSSLGDAYLSYLRGDLVARRMREEGYVPCYRSDGNIEALCQGSGR